MRKSEIPTSAMLQLDGVTKRFGQHDVVSPLSLTIAEGEYVTLLGPSGCGKTTLLRMISGLEVPTAGRVAIAGRDVTRLPAERRPCNMVFQSYALFPHLSVFENIAYGPRAMGVGEQETARRVRAALAIVKLDSQAAHSISQLSGGMSQRVALARAIVCEPKVLLLDEPLAALDLNLRKHMQIELRTIQKRIGTTFVHVTHDQEEALALSDRIVLMRNGRVEQIGTPREIYGKPRNRFVAEFMGDTSKLSCQVSRDMGNAVEVVLPAGQVHCFPYYGAALLAQGERGFVVLRPAHLDFSGDLAGTIESSVFVGDALRHQVQLVTGDVVNVSAADDTRLEPGSTVGVGIKPGAGVFVRADD